MSSKLRGLRPDDARVGDVLVGIQAVLLALLASGGQWLPDADPAQGPGRGRPRSLAVARQLVGTGMILVGGAVALAGAGTLGEHLTPSPLPRPGAELRTTGVYAHVRHPIYSGLLLGAAGRAVSTGRRRHVVAALGLGLLLTAKSYLEEDLLRRKFPDYDSYAAVTPRLVPRRRARG